MTTILSILFLVLIYYYVYLYRQTRSVMRLMVVGFIAYYVLLSLIYNIYITASPYFN